MLDQLRQKNRRHREGDVSERVKLLVWAQAAGHCQSCNAYLIGHLVAGNRKANKGYVAHIIGASANGPRGDPELSKELAKDPDNVMLLCDGCHRTIDRDMPETYPVDRLRQMKQAQENWVRRAIGLGMQSQSHILRFTNKIEANETSIPIDECIRAIRAIGKTPATFEPIDLKIGMSGPSDSEELYWAAEPADLRLFFNERLKGRFNSGSVRHLSVFGFGPMPLLVLLGRLLPDLLDLDVFTRHREPSPSWTWRTEASGFSPRVGEGAPGPSRVAVKLAITDHIADERITNAVGASNLSIWSITCEAPGYEVLRTREDLSKFRTTVRAAFNRIKEVHGETAEVMVFPAAPAACCIEFGRVWQPKAHRPMEIFDHSKEEGFVRRLRIE